MFENRKIVVQGIFVLVGLVYIIKLLSLQMFDDNYKMKAQKNIKRRIVEYPYRGLIYDRNGKELVYNNPVFDLMVVPREVKDLDTTAFCRLFKLTKEEFEVKMKDAVTPPKGSWSKPWPFIKQLSIKDFAKVQDYLVDFKGFYTQARTVRSYPHQSLANALGYIREIDKAQLDRQEDNYYSSGDYIGKSGLELHYEKHLRGRRGVRHVMVNVKGVEKGPFKGGMYDTLSVPGENLTASIDLELQKYGEKLMRNKRGSVVAIEPSTGEILSFVSAPSYDPNALTGRNFGENYLRLERDTLKPLFNRPLMAMYPPGSIFKIPQALIAMQMGVLNENTKYPCNKALVKCHPHDSPVDVMGSIQHSCNPYYYLVFKNILNQDLDPNKYKDTEIGFDKWREHITRFGFGNRLGIDIPSEKPGNIPSNSYYDRIYGDLRWKFTTIYSLGIGQGEIGAVPLQMANLAAIIANKGHYYTPHFIKAIGEEGKPLAEYRKKHDTGVDPKHFDVVIDGMEKVVTSGTAMRSRIKGIPMCGKTGTAQNPHGEDHSVFIAFAPKDDPKIAIAVFVENAGFGGTWAAPIASLMIEKYISDTITRPHLEKYILDKKFYEDQILDIN
ncbi:penicillin-binding protein 2 [Cytophagaceae bacterium ABcell3]|nr:penicillin-binding protein 2 [Cytophagaceae bacterium ABcell3]